MAVPSISTVMSTFNMPLTKQKGDTFNGEAMFKAIVLIYN